MSHYKQVCSCGKVISQCRCIGFKTVHIDPNGCKDCQEAKRYIDECISKTTEKAFIKGLQAS